MEQKKPNPAPTSRDARGSLEVFNPSTNSNQPTRVSRPSPLPIPLPQSTAELPPPQLVPNIDDQSISTSWMALPTPPKKQSLATIINDGKKSPAVANAGGEVGAAEQRAAEWGLVLKTDEETGKPQGVKVRNSGGDTSSVGAAGSSRRNSGRDSGDLSDDGGTYIVSSYCSRVYILTLRLRKIT